MQLRVQPSHWSPSWAERPASIQALLMMAHFLFLTDRSGNERRWLLKGLCTKVIQMVG